MTTGGRTRKKRFRNRGKMWQLIGLAVLALVTLGVVAYTLIPSRVEPTATPAPKPSAATTTAPAPRVAFMGDSYTAGTGSTATGNRWTARLSASLGWDELNFGQGGSGFTGGGGKDSTGTERLSYPAMIPAVAEAKPDVVVVATAGNDFNRGPSAFQPAAAEFFTDLRAALPETKIIVVSPMWRGPEAHEHLAALRKSLKDGAASVNGTHLDIGPTFQTALTDGLLGTDSIHPNDKGHAELAAEVAAAYKAATPAG